MQPVQRMPSGHGLCAPVTPFVPIPPLVSDPADRQAENHDVPISAAEIVKQGFMSQEDFSFVESKAGLSRGKRPGAPLHARIRSRMDVAAPP